MIGMTETLNRHQLLGKRDFWNTLAYMACVCLQDSDDPLLRRFWIDDFMPERAINTKSGVEFEGVAWVGKARGQAEYRFTASIPQKLLHRWKQGFVIDQILLDETQRTLQLRTVIA